MNSSIGHTYGSNLAIKIAKNLQPAKINLLLQFGGINSDITPAYFWITQFRNYTNKGFQFIKIEDVHHFSEASQFGGNFRQIKGGSIRAFQENLNQIVQLIKVHLMPLLKEIKQAHMYKIWMDRILENDEYLFQELQKSKDKQNKEKIIKFRNERNEAINHLKDKWVSEVDGGKLWTVSRSSQEQGLDMTLLPQLFFGTYLDDPFERKTSLKEQLDDSTYKVDITADAKTQVARFQYRFYTWLPTAIRDTQTTFNIKIASLRQFYAQIEMQMQFMKPLLMEISKKSEKMHTGNFFSGYGDEDPTMVKLFDTTISFIRVIGPQNFIHGGGWSPGQYKLEDLEFTRFGLLIPNNAFVKNPLNSSGILTDIIVKDNKITHYLVKKFNGDRDDAQKLNRYEFEKLEEYKIPHYYFKPYATPELTFKQERRTEMIQTQQGMQQAPYMENSIEYFGKVMNFMEVAAYRQKVRTDDIHLLESFIQELGAVKDELLMYLNYQEGDDINNLGIDFSRYKHGNNTSKNTNDLENEDKKKLSFSDKLVNSLFASNTKTPKDGPKTVNNSKIKKDYEKIYTKAENQVIEEVWKSYNIYKKVGGYVAY